MKLTLENKLKLANHQVVAQTVASSYKLANMKAIFTEELSYIKADTMATWKQERAQLLAKLDEYEAKEKEMTQK